MGNYIERDYSLALRREKCWIKKMILEKTEVLFCYGKYPILIQMKTPIVKPVGLKM